jgi:hypothetical protein
MKIDSVFHRAFIDVDEDGTEAAAATVFAMAEEIGDEEPLPRPPPKIFRADHPFLFLICDRTSEAILFIGRVSDASALKRDDPIFREAEERGARNKQLRELAEKLFARVQSSGVVCPNCKVHTKNIKYTQGRTFMICRECGCSFTPDRIDM